MSIFLCCVSGISLIALGAICNHVYWYYQFQKYKNDCDMALFKLKSDLIKTNINKG